MNAPVNPAVVSFADVEAAARRIGGHIERTPTRFSRRLSDLSGAEVYVKYENQQYTASFKERGALNKLLQLSDAERQRGVIAASAGSHASALAYHGKRLGIPVTIVMPRGTPFIKIERTAVFGANVVIEGANFDESLAYAMMLRTDQNSVLAHPFNDADIIAGQGTTGLEMLEDQPHIEDLLVPIGGGGLVAGMATAAKAMRPQTRIFGVEAALYPCFLNRRTQANTPCAGQTIAEGMAVKEIGSLTFAVANPLVEDVLLCDESELEHAVGLFATQERTVAEGAGGASLAALLRHKDLFQGRKVGVVLSGGNIDSRLLASVLQRELVRAQRLVMLRIIGDDRPGMLAEIAQVIASMGANIIDVAHNRLLLDVAAKGAEFDIMIETQTSTHADEIISVLKDRGYAFRMD